MGTLDELPRVTTHDLFGDTGGATFSPCRKYRYHLWRRLVEVASHDEATAHRLNAVAFLMLNPSTADEVESDPTVTRCINYARAWGYQRLDVINLFAWRSTDPEGLSEPADPVGHPDNDRMILWTAQNADIVCAWGGGKPKVAKLVKTRAVRVRTLLAGAELTALRVSAKSGQPWHPLYLPGDLKPEAFA